MAHTYEELKKMTVADLREIAKAEGIKGSTQMNKEHVLEEICKTLNIDMHVHHDVVGVDKGAIKRRIKELKKERDQFLQDKKKDDLKKVRKQIKTLKRKLRAATV